MMEDQIERKSSEKQKHLERAELRFEEPISFRNTVSEIDNEPVFSRRRSKSQGHLLPGRSLYEYDPFDLNSFAEEDHENGILTEVIKPSNLREETIRRGVSNSFHVFESDVLERSQSPLLSHLNARERSESDFERHHPHIVDSTVPGTSKGDWTCLSCGNSNYSWRHVCNMRKCRAPKPGNIPDYSPPGSWTCAACGNLNYAERMICNMRKCRAPRALSTPVVALNQYLQQPQVSPVYGGANFGQTPDRYYDFQQAQHQYDNASFFSRNNIGQ